MARRKEMHLHGNGACQGVVTGTLRYIPPSEGIYLKERLEKIEDGDIVLTRMTSPEIIPHLGRIKGIITEVGGIVCHAAILAREYNIPTVVACDGIIKHIARRRNPTFVSLNGLTGEVILDG